MAKRYRPDTENYATEGEEEGIIVPLKVGKPFWKHPCTNCIYLGSLKLSKDCRDQEEQIQDFYVCPKADGRYDLLRRFDGEETEYVTCHCDAYAMMLLYLALCAGWLCLEHSNAETSCTSKELDIDRCILYKDCYYCRFCTEPVLIVQSEQTLARQQEHESTHTN